VASALLTLLNNSVKAFESNVRSEFADEILRYLLEHPEAQDTIDGIADWWLTERRVRQGIDEVQVALRSLVDRGLVEAVVHEDGRCHYCLKPEIEQNNRKRPNTPQ